jgi:hypothetical protein
MILDVEKLGRILFLHIMIGAALYLLTPVASFAYFVAATIIASIQSYRAWEAMLAQDKQLELLRLKVPELDKFMKKMDGILEDAKDVTNE